MQRRLFTSPRFVCVLLAAFEGAGLLLGTSSCSSPAPQPAAASAERPSQTSSAKPDAQPNVLLILTDDQRWDAMSCAGNPSLHTPNIDRLAREGVRFQNMFCTTSLCSPSRASILSGLYAHTHGVINNFTEYPTHLASFPRVLQSIGYDTAYIGKWHMGETNDAPRPGFNWFVTHKGQGAYFNTEFNLNGQERKAIPGYYTHVVTDLAEEWLRRPRSGPFLLMLGHKAPHSFYLPEAKYSNAFAQVDIPYPASAFALEDKPEWIRQRLTTWHGIYGPLFEWRKNFPDTSPEGVTAFANMTRAYWGTILSVDDSVGRLYQVLQQMGQLERTIIVFMGDNGLLNGEHGMVDKRTMHEASIRIPLIVRYPGWVSPAKPVVVEKQVLTLDVAPSILDLCGAPPLPKTHGQSFRRLGLGDTTGWRDAWYYEYNYEKQFPYTPNVRGIRTDDWKYMHYPHGDGGPDRHLSELYHIASDPLEEHNLVNDPNYALVVSRLQTRLDQLMQEADAGADPMPLDEGVKSELPEASIR